MTHLRWQQVKHLFDAAISRTPSERVRLLDEACADDETLRREVEMLLASHEQAASFLETPAVAKMAQVIITDAAPTLAAGASVGHYRIIKPLGAGGMGEVYLAEDVRLNRRVALKILLAETLADRQARRRFAQEARAASALNHPHIVTIYDVELADAQAGRSFIAMEYVAGESLAEKMKGAPLPATEIVTIAAQIADALDAAHTAGIVHRDIKPANIMLNTRGQVKVLDFGLAKMSAPPPLASDAATQLQTAAGAILGTVSYMSPEQALGKAVDSRTDIFSFGVLLYEMLTARRPFEGDTASEIIDKIVHRAPDAIARFNYDAPPELERIARKCLEKDRERRYQTARELFIDLQNLQRDHIAQDASTRDIEAHATSPHISDAAEITSTAKTARVSSPAATIGVKSRPLIIAAAIGAVLIAVALVYVWRTSRAVPVSSANEIKSLAVLPLVNSGGDAEKEYLADGITESLINRLSQLPNLKVMSRNTVFRFKGKDADAQKVAQQLGVRAVMTGNVQQIDEQLVINVELIDANDGSVISSQQYIRKASDVIVMQANIAQDVVSNLRVKLTGVDEQQLAKRYTDNVEAYQLYLKGQYEWRKHTEEDVRKAIEYFNQALEKDPNYALAYSGLSASYGVLGNNYLPPHEAQPKAKAYAAKALAIDDTLAEAHVAMGVIRMGYDWNWAEAEREFKRALTLDPDNVGAHHMYGDRLEIMGRFDEAQAERKRALELDPLSPMQSMVAGATFYFAGQYTEAIAQNEKTINLEPRYTPAYLWLGQAYEQNKMYAEAIATFQKGMDKAERHPQLIAALGHTYALIGERDKANKALDELREMAKHRYISPYFFAVVYVGLGDKDQAFAWLDKAYQDRSGMLIWLKVEPQFDSLRADPRFQDLLRRVGLAQ